MLIILLLVIREPVKIAPDGGASSYGKQGIQNLTQATEVLTKDNLHERKKPTLRNSQQYIKRYGDSVRSTNQRLDDREPIRLEHNRPYTITSCSDSI